MARLTREIQRSRGNRKPEDWLGAQTEGSAKVQLRRSRVQKCKGGRQVREGARGHVDTRAAGSLVQAFGFGYRFGI